MAQDNAPASFGSKDPRTLAHVSSRKATSRSGLQAVWPVAVIGALSAMAGNPLALRSISTGAPAPVLAQSFADRPSSTYVSPDGRSFARLVEMHVLPDPTQTPGWLNPDVNDKTISTTICTHGWTKTVRPPASYTNQIKERSVPAGHDKSEYELDHLASIEDGGDPKAEANLWMQSYNDLYGARIKDVLETKLAHMVCNHQISLADARAALSPNWLVGFERYVGPLPEPEGDGS